MECSENVQLSLAAAGQRHSAQRPRPVVLGRHPQQEALGLQQEDSARVRRRVVSGQNLQLQGRCRRLQVLAGCLLQSQELVRVCLQTLTKDGLRRRQVPQIHRLWLRYQVSSRSASPRMEVPLYGRLVEYQCLGQPTHTDSLGCKRTQSNLGSRTLQIQRSTFSAMCGKWP